MIRKTIQKLLHSLNDRFEVTIKRTKWKLGDNKMKRIVPNKELMAKLMQSDYPIEPWQRVYETDIVDKEIMKKLGLVSGTYKEKTYIVVPETCGDINIFLDTYWALVNKTIPRNSLFIKHPIAFKKEVGEDVYKELRELLANDREEYEVRIIGKNKGEENAEPSR